MLLRISNFLTRLIDKNKILQKETQTKRDGGIRTVSCNFLKFSRKPRKDSFDYQHIGAITVAYDSRKLSNEEILDVAIPRTMPRTNLQLDLFQFILYMPVRTSNAKRP